MDSGAAGIPIGVAKAIIEAARAIAQAVARIFRQDAKALVDAGLDGLIHNVRVPTCVDSRRASPSSGWPACARWTAGASRQ
jgi:hypothetical protein